MEKILQEPEWNEIEKAIPPQIKEIRSILEDKYGIVIPCHCDEFIARCLRLKDGKKDKAIKLIKHFQTTMVGFREWDATMQPSLYETFVRNVVIPLSQKDSHGRRIFVFRTEMWDPQLTNFDELLAALWMCAQFITAEYKDAQHSGFVTIWDFSNFSLQQAWAVNQWRLISLMKWVQNGVAGRIKGFHLIFQPRIISVIYAGVKPFFKEKLRKRIHFHNSLETLHQHVNPQCLPEFLGGVLNHEEDKCIDKLSIKKLFQQDDFFKEMINSGFPSK